MEAIWAVVAGHLCLDIIPGLELGPQTNMADVLQPGHLLITGPAVLSTGGPVSNTGLALHRLGIPTRLIAKLGTDPFAQVIRSLVVSHGAELTAGLVDDSASPTSYCVILSQPGVDRLFIHCPGANDTFGVEDVDFDLVAQARLFHFGYPPVMRRMYTQGGREMVELFRRVKACGTTTSLDMTFPDPAAEGGQVDWRAILRDLLPYVDVFLPSLDELLFMLHRAEYEQVSRAHPAESLAAVLPTERLSALGAELIDLGAKVVVIKLGDRGLYLRSSGEKALRKMGRAAPRLQAWADRELRSACFSVDVVGTTGSGDATIAGFLSALLRGFDPEDAMTAAVAVGACNVEAADALSGLRSWEDTLARVAAGWPHRPLELDRSSWVEIRPGLWQKIITELK
jgi:sugar/nucleoside kinase (ribokinase family)